MVERNVATRRGVVVVDGSGCIGFGRGGTSSSRCMNLPFLSLEDFKVNSSFLCHVLGQNTNFVFKSSLGPSIRSSIS